MCSSINFLLVFVCFLHNMFSKKNDICWIILGTFRSLNSDLIVFIRNLYFCFPNSLVFCNIAFNNNLIGDAKMSFSSKSVLIILFLIAMQYINKLSKVCPLWESCENCSPYRFPLFFYLFITLGCIRPSIKSKYHTKITWDDKQFLNYHYQYSRGKNL